MSEDVVAAFKGELQFAGWTDSSRGGPRVTFRLADRDQLERFIGCEGKRYACMLVELGDDEQPAAPAQATPATTSAQRERLGPLCEWAVQRCGEAAFQDWASHQTHAGGGQFKYRNMAEEARGVILTLCGVASRKELDTNSEAADRFHKLVRRPYGEWAMANKSLVTY